MAVQVDFEDVKAGEHMTNQAEPADKSEIKILVVDDREDNLFSIETILEKDGYTIVKANSGRAALKVLLQEHDFSLMLMDVQMPDMNGFETAKLIYDREKLRDIPIIFITAHNYTEDFIFKGYKMGGVDYIYKPIDPELLRVKVGVFVDLYRKNHQLLRQEEALRKINHSLQKEIEERRLNEEKVRVLNEQLLQNNFDLRSTIEELDRFAYVASHDLQEPLRKIILFSEKLSIGLEDVPNNELKNHLSKIVRSSTRMKTLINDLLRFSRQVQTSADFNLLPLNTVVDEVLADLEMEIQQKSAVIKIGQLPEIRGVRSQIFQLFQNLISNSLKFSRSEVTPVIEIFEEFEDEASLPPGVTAMRRIVVRDNGIGFDPQYAEEIFKIFKRLHSYQEFEGSGIGLSICKKIVEWHRGKIDAFSTLGNGSTFVIRLPDTSVI